MLGNAEASRRELLVRWSECCSRYSEKEMPAMKLLKRYQEKLSSIPAPGRCCHPFLLAVANLGVQSGLTTKKIFADIRRSIPSGSRQVSDQEIMDAISKAEADHGRGNSKTFKPKPSPTVPDKKVALRNIIRQSQVTNEGDLWELSPVRITGTPQEDILIFIGDRCEPGIIGKTIRTAGQWITYFQHGGKAGPYIIPNPMSGMEGLTKDGKPSFRCDNTVHAYLCCVGEFDDIAREDQLRFWSGVKLPIFALIDSGGKSIHAWLDVQKMAKVETPEQWTTLIKSRLYNQNLIPMGVDPACSNPSRLSRLPGHFREEKKAYQKLLWLSPEGRPICQ
jgi:hypothetical protein